MTDETDLETRVAELELAVLSLARVEFVGDLPGHPFRGNQHTENAGSRARDAADNAKADAKTTRTLGERPKAKNGVPQMRSKGFHQAAEQDAKDVATGASRARADKELTKAAQLPKGVTAHLLGNPNDQSSVLEVGFKIDGKSTGYKWNYNDAEIQHDGMTQHATDKAFAKAFGENNPRDVSMSDMAENVSDAIANHIDQKYPA
jgi:hypothetical protein